MTEQDWDASNTEEQWESCEDPRMLLAWLRGGASQRKLRLFACAFWALWWHRPQGSEGCAIEADPDVSLLLEYAGSWAEGGERPGCPLPGGFAFGWHPLVARDALDAAGWTVRQTSGGKSRIDRRRSDGMDRTLAAEFQVRLLRDIFGNPFRPSAIDAGRLSGNGGCVLHLATGIYQGPDFSLERMCVLADALEEAGVTDEGVLGHCRQPGAIHARGCHVVDLAFETTPRTTSGEEP